MLSSDEEDGVKSDGPQHVSESRSPNLPVVFVGEERGLCCIVMYTVVA